MKDHRDNLCVCGGGGRSQHFHTKLVEFPQPSRLGLFVAEGGQQIRRLYRQRVTQKAVFNGASKGPGSPFRPQGNRPAALILKGVHLFLHHIGGITHRTVKQFRMLKGGDPNLPKTVQSNGFHHFFL